MTKLAGVDFVLQTIGFDVAAERAAIMEAGINLFDDFCYLTVKE